VAEPQHHTFETHGRVALHVEIPAGRLTVETWSEPRVEIEVAPGRDDDRSIRAAADTSVTASQRAGRDEIVVRAPKREGRPSIGFGRGPELAVSIRCPERADLDHATHSADVRVTGGLGAVSARSASGDAILEDADTVGFTTASGDLTAGSVAGSLTTKSASGDVDVRSVGETASVNTVSGDVRLGRSEGDVKIQTVSGDVDLEAVGGSVVVGSVSGDVEVAALPGLVLRIDAQSVSGTMRSELEVGDEPAGPGEESVDLRVRTVSGDVRVARSPAPAR
jgi:DUF4097 and DUF4098 domain-containing protein YvlB